MLIYTHTCHLPVLSVSLLFALPVNEKWFLGDANVIIRLYLWFFLKQQVIARLSWYWKNLP